MKKFEKCIIFNLVLLVSFWKCHTLRCQLDDGPSEEEIKKVVRICMRKLGGDSDRNNSENSYEDNNSDEDNDNKSSFGRGKNNNNNRGNRFARHADMMVDRWQQQQSYDNSYGNRNQQRYDNNYGNNGNNGFNNGNDFGNTGYSNNENNRNYNLGNRNKNYDQNGMEDKSCMTQCFFQEMKMTNSDGFPDKHKVERIITQDIRDREMKSFLMDSIQECFHIVEMERRREKCVFSKNIVSCLAERAKANCDDYYNETMIF